MSFFDYDPANKLLAAGIKAPKTIAYGELWGGLFEKRSFAISEKIPNAQSLEKKLPDCFGGPKSCENILQRKKFIGELAVFVKKFHDSGYRHRDLYFAHIFYSDIGEFYLIDLARAFKPKMLAERFRVKDIAQLYYSAPGRYFTKGDRLRFYLSYCGRRRLSRKDKAFIGKIKAKVKRMAGHDIKHGRIVPFSSKGD